jgi:hypothetical protein
MDVPIKVPLPDSLREKLAQPVCVPLPPPGKIDLNLPTGGRIQALVDITKAIPDDCSLSFSLALQLGPILANLDCLFKIVGVIKPLVEAVQAIGKPDPTKIPGALMDLATAVPPLLDCIAKFMGLGVFLFVRDLLRLLAKILRCVCQQMRSVLNVLSGIGLQLSSAKADGNTELAAALECARNNAQTSMQHALTAVEPVFVLLSIAEPFLGLAGVNPIKSPALASPDDLKAMLKTIETLEQVAKAMETVADGVKVPQ